MTLLQICVFWIFHENGGYIIYIFSVTFFIWCEVFDVHPPCSMSQYFSHFLLPNYILLYGYVTFGFPITFSGSDSKESACNARDWGSVPGLGRSPGEGNGNLLQYSCLKNPIDLGTWPAVHRIAKSCTQISNHHFHTFHFHQLIDIYIASNLCTSFCMDMCFHFSWYIPRSWNAKSYGNYV